jgi:CBS domain-containing protein
VKQAASVSPAPGTAQDVMTRAVISVTLGTSVRDVATLMLTNRVSAVPVLNSAGHLVGMVSEGDLLDRGDAKRVPGHDWWLALLQSAGALSRPLDTLAIHLVDDVMHTPAVTVEARTPLPTVAGLLRSHCIKRLPVMEGGRMVGIVSRADVLRFLETMATPERAARIEGFLGTLMSMGGDTAHQPAGPVIVATPAEPTLPPITAAAFRDLVAASELVKRDQEKAAAGATKLARTRQVKAMLQDHLNEDMWTALMAHARTAATQGAKSLELLRFPCDLCDDGGRKIDVEDAAWPTTLRGEAAELYRHWERDLKPAGFGIAAEIADYPGGMPGDVALTLTWPG